MKIPLWKIALFVSLVLVMAYGIFPGDRQLSEMFLGNFEYDKSDPLILKAYKDRPNDTRALRNLARYYQIQGKYEEEKKIYDRLIEILPKNIEFRFGLARYYSWNNQPLKEFEELKIIRKIDPKNEKLLLRLIDFYTWQKNAEELIAVMKELIAFEPRNPEHYERLANNYLRLDNPKEAIKVYQELTSFYHKDIKYHLLLTELLEWQGMFQKGIDTLLLALRIKWGRFVSAPPRMKLPDEIDEVDQDIFSQMGILYINLKQGKKVLALYETILKKNPGNVPTREDYAAFLDGLNHDEQAIEQYEILLKDNPTALKYMHMLANIYISIERLPDAEKILYKAYKLNPDHGPNVAALASVYIYMGEAKKGIPYLHKYLKKHKADWALKRVQAGAYFHAGLRQKAIVLYTEILKQFPDEEEAIHHLAHSYLYSEQPEKAIAYYQKLTDKFPEKRLYAVRLGECFVQARRIESGISVFKEQLQIEPLDLRTTVLVANAYSRLQWWGQARVYYKKVITLLKNNKLDDLMFSDIEFEDRKKKKDRKLDSEQRDSGSTTKESLAELKQADIPEKRKEEIQLGMTLMKVSALHQLKRHREAFEVLTKLYEKYPRDKRVIIPYAYAHMILNRHEEAYDFLYRYSLTYDDPEISRALAALNKDVEDDYTASRYYKKVLEINPGDREALLQITLNYRGANQEVDAMKISTQLYKKYFWEGGVRSLDDTFMASYGPKFSSYYYFKRLLTNEMIRFQQTHFEQRLSNRFKFLADVQFGNWRHGGSKINEYVTVVDLGGNYFLNDHLNTTLQLRQSYASQSKIGFYFAQEVNLWLKQNFAARLTAKLKYNYLWVDPIKTIPFEATTDTYELSYSQEFLRNNITFNATTSIIDSHTKNGGDGRERTFETKLGWRIFPTNPKLILSFRYFRDSPTKETIRDTNLAKVVGLVPVLQYHYIVDFNYMFPNGITLLSSQTWSGHKNQKRANIFRASKSLIGWTTGAMLPLTKRWKATFNFGNSSAGSEGGIANADSKIYFGNLEYIFYK